MFDAINNLPSPPSRLICWRGNIIDLNAIKHVASRRGSKLEIMFKDGSSEIYSYNNNSDRSDAINDLWKEILNEQRRAKS